MIFSERLPAVTAGDARRSALMACRLRAVVPGRSNRGVVKSSRSSSRAHPYPLDHSVRFHEA